MHCLRKIGLVLWASLRLERPFAANGIAQTKRMFRGAGLHASEILWQEGDRLLQTVPPGGLVEARLLVDFAPFAANGVALTSCDLY